MPPSLTLRKVPRDRRLRTASGLIPSWRAASGTVYRDISLGVSPSPTAPYYRPLGEMLLAVRSHPRPSETVSDFEPGLPELAL